MFLPASCIVLLGDEWSRRSPLHSLNLWPFLMLKTTGSIDLLLGACFGVRFDSLVMVEEYMC